MNVKIAIAIAVLVTTIVLGAWISLQLHVRKQYNDFRVELGSYVMEMAKLDLETEALLADIQDNWVESHSEIDGPHAGALEEIGLRPDVTNLVHLFTYQLPPYSFLSPTQAGRDMAKGVMQAVILPVSLDGLVHVSADGQLAMVRCGHGVVYVFANDREGLRETMYVRPSSTGQDALTTDN